MTVALGSRPIEVGGTAYRWTLRRRPIRNDGWTLLTFVMEQDTGQGALLVLRLPAGPVPPSVVDEGVSRALTAGWRPGSRGPAPRSRSRLHHGRNEPRGGPVLRPPRRAGHRRAD